MEINKLIEALARSPENDSLRRLVAEGMVDSMRYAEAIAEYKTLLRNDPDNQEIVVLLAECYYYTGEYSVAMVMIEDMVFKPDASIRCSKLFIRLLIKEGNMELATNLYRDLVTYHPEHAESEFDKVLRVPYLSMDQLSSGDVILDDEDFIMDKPEIDFSDVGGMDRMKKEIEMKIIAPLKHPELYRAYGKKTGGGILLYGPPGCGKTYLARATAGEIDSNFISIGLEDVLDMWLGESEKNMHDIFEHARRNTPCVLFFDEVDALGAKRSDMRQLAGRSTVIQFLAELDGVSSNNEGILVLAATNAPWYLDAAFRRPGRFDRIIFVEPPDQKGREEILKIHLKEKPVDNVSYADVAKQCVHFSGADLQAVVDIAVEKRLSEAIASGKMKSITTGDLLSAAKKHVPSTQEWFVKARNYALYSNESGLYDDILKYLKIKK